MRVGSVKIDHLAQAHHIRKVAATHFNETRAVGALRKSWSPQTARQWRADNPALRQCNVTALVIHDVFGGQILKTPVPGGAHFCNRLDGRRFDFTSGQFDRPISYTDAAASPAGARAGAGENEYETLKTCLLNHYDKTAS